MGSVNNCNYTVWPGILSNAGVPQLYTTGLTLQPGQSETLSVPFSWGGRLWGRSFCTQEPSGKFTCLTGDCGSSTVECSGNGAALPATLAEFTLNGANGLDVYDVSLVDGYNLPMLVTPQGGQTGQGKCTFTGCIKDLNPSCPAELKVAANNGENVVACKSACSAFGDPKYCCCGAYSNPDTCKPTSYSEIFKTACPRAYSYAYDDQTITFTCAGADYVISFCPSPSSSTSSSSAATPIVTPRQKSGKIPGPEDRTLVFAGSHGISLHSIGGAIITVAAMLQLCRLRAD
ncbi:unnamed protein product [Dovyalis caffra]|uniref:Thaumatin-like protein n=1 Tax=Dovyalis caffra TaxID=77055 RepID=A0AAV1RDI3_9ROSI|nr:unnamed protein product [Dovyalis caffra]